MEQLMRTILLTGVGLFLAGVAQDSALAMGGMGGPSDAWGSPYALYAPQTSSPPPGWGPLERRSAYEGRAVAPVDCRGDRACERRMRKSARPGPAQ
jgi:hypothetical protein